MSTTIDPANRQTNTIKALILIDPMTFDSVPTAWTLTPFGYRTRRKTIMTRDPNIFMTIPSPGKADYIFSIKAVAYHKASFCGLLATALAASLPLTAQPVAGSRYGRLRKR